MMQGEEGGNTFHCVTTDIHPVLKQATEAANGKDIRFGGGVATIRQYLRAGLIDERHVVLTPLVLGSGEHLFGDLDGRNLGHQCTEHVPTPNATHIVRSKTREERQGC